MLRAVICACCVLSAVAVMPSWGFLPVIDVHAIGSLMKQLSQMKKDYAAIKEVSQVSSRGFDQVASALGGQFSYGDMKNDWQSIQSRYGSFDRWSDWLEAGQSDDSSSAKTYAATHALWSDKRWLQDIPDTERDAIESQLKRLRAASLSSGEVYDHSQQRQQVLRDFSKQINATSNTKAAIDLNSRLSVESQYAQDAALKQVSLLNKQIAEKQYQQLAEQQKEMSFTTIDEKENTREW